MIAAAVIAAIQNAGTMVSYNGSEFDLPWLRRLLCPPFPRLPHHLDLLVEARWWKEYGGWRRASLSNVAGFVGIPRIDATDGEQVATLCTRILQGERGEVLQAVLDHNLDDLLQVLHLVPLFFGSPAPQWLTPAGRRRWGMLTARAGFMVDPEGRPNSRQRRFLAELAERLGVPAPAPSTKREAAQAIDHLLSLDQIRETLAEAAAIATSLIPPEPVPVADTLEAAQAHLSRLKNLRRDPLRRPASQPQLELLQKMATVAGIPLPEVRTYADASREIDRLKPFQRYGPPSPGQLGYIRSLAERCSLPPQDVTALPSTGVAAGDLIDYLASCLNRADGPDMIASLDGARRAAAMYDQPDLVEGFHPEWVDPVWVDLLSHWEKHERPFSIDQPTPELVATLRAMLRHGGLIHWVQSDVIGEGYRVFKGWRWILEQTLPPPPSPPDPLPKGQPKRVRMRVLQDGSYLEDGVMLLQCQGDWYGAKMRVVLPGDYVRARELRSGSSHTAEVHPDAGELTAEVVTRIRFSHGRCHIEIVDTERFRTLWSEADPARRRRTKAKAGASAGDMP